MALSRPARITLWSVLGVVSVLVLCLIVLATFDWNRAKPWLSQRVSEATGRPFAINGDLSVSWQRSDLPRAGLAGWIPWPHLSAQDLSLGNPAWAQDKEMAHIGRLTFLLDPWPLWQHRIVLPLLRLEQPVVQLERQKDGRNNWTFKKDDQDSDWKLELGRLMLEEGTIRLKDAIRKADLQAEINTLPPEQAQEYGLRWTLSGKLDRAKVKGTGKAGAILSLQEDDPYPLQVDLDVDQTSITAEGTLTKPAALAALDMQLKLSGRSLAHLYPILGVLLPESPAFATKGRLSAAITDAGGRWHYDDFTGTVGKSDLAGSIAFLERTKDDKQGQGRVLDRPLLQGSLVSKQLRLQDLAPLIGANTAAPSKADAQARQARVAQPKDKSLPVQTFSTQRWTTLDADIAFKAKKIVHDKDLPIDDLKTEVHLKNGVLRFTPLNFGVAGGNLVSTLTLDGSGKQIQARLDMQARRLKLQQLLPTPPDMKASIGEMNGDAALTSTGNSVASLLGSANGQVKALIDQGTISKLLLEQIGLNVGGIIMTTLFGDEQIEINCMASDFAVNKGVMRPKIFVVDTEKTVIFMEGQVDLAKEQLDLTILPRNRTLQLFSLRAPLYVTGSFKHPEVEVDKGVLVAKAAGALALGALAPVAALLPLVNVGEDAPSGCQRLIQQARQAPKAPAAGK